VVTYRLWVCCCLFRDQTEASLANNKHRSDTALLAVVLAVFGARLGTSQVSTWNQYSAERKKNDAGRNRAQERPHRPLRWHCIRKLLSQVPTGDCSVFTLTPSIQKWHPGNIRPSAEVEQQRRCTARKPAALHQVSPANPYVPLPFPSSRCPRVETRICKLFALLQQPQPLPPLNLFQSPQYLLTRTKKNTPNQGLLPFLSRA